jgi:uncharacterized protein (TIGR02246 family)
VSIHKLIVPALAALLWHVAADGAWAQRPKGNPQDEAALLKGAEAFVDAFHKGDAKAVAAHWTPDGDYIDQTGKHMKGRDDIEKAFAGLFAEHKGLKLRIDIAALKFVTPDVAIEDGTTAVIPPDGGPPSRARYSIVHVKKNGQWYLSSVRDAPFAAPTNLPHLGGLEWLIGDWAADDAKGETARIAYSWTESQNFIVATFTTTFKDIAIGGGTEWIGWDPLAKHIRSWIFETGGGFGEGSFTQDQDKWIVKSTLLLPDGKKLAATNVITRTGADTMTWQSRDRTIDGQSLPEVKAITMKRVK